MAKQQASADPLKLVLSTHRMSYVHLDKPSSIKINGEESKPVYSVTFLIPKNHPDVAKITACLQRCHKEQGPAKFPGLPFTSPKLWNPLRDGDEYADEKVGEGAKEEQVAPYRNHYYLKATSGGDKPAPIVFSQNPDGTRDEVIDVANEVYSGAYGRGVLKCAAFNTVQKGFGFYINSVCKTKDGPRLGGFTADEADYELDEDATDLEADYDATAPVSRPAPKAAPKVDPYTYAETEDGTPIRSLNGVDWEFYR